MEKTPLESFISNCDGVVYKITNLALYNWCFLDVTICHSYNTLFLQRQTTVYINLG